MRKVFWGRGKDVSVFSDKDRRLHDLATEDSIVEICGEDHLMDEMVAYCREKKLVGFDTETTGLNFFSDRIVLAQIGDLERQYLIWLDKTDPQKLLEIIRDPEVIKIGLNLKFDLTFLLYQYGFEEARAQRVVDTFISAQVLMCGIYDNVKLTMGMTGMYSQAQHWLGLDIPKDVELRVGWSGWDPHSFSERYAHITDEEATQHLQELRRRKILYAADDVNIPILLAKAHWPWILELGLSDTIALENRFLPVLADIEARGLPFDAEAWMALANEAAQKAKEARRDLDALFETEVHVVVDEDNRATYTRDIKYSSPAQLGDAIHEWMLTNCGVEVIYTNAHFKAAIERTGRVPQERIDLLFKPRMEPDPEKPGKKRKCAYPNQRDVVESMWDFYCGMLPPYAFVLPNTDSKTLKFLRVIYQTPLEVLMPDKEKLPSIYGLPPALVDPILELRGESKKVSTYGANWLGIMAPDGRVHTNFVQAALSTGRLSSSPNAQNFPADDAYRACFRAEPGYKMVGADYSQIEPRVLAHVSQDPTYMRVFWSERPNAEGFRKWGDASITDSLDLYTEVGKAIGQIPSHYTKLDTQGDEEAGIPPKPDGKKGRKQAKIANLGLGYGTGVNKFHYMLCIDTGEYQSFSAVTKLYKDYWSAMNVVKAFLDASSNITDWEKSPRKVTNPYTSGLVTYAETLLGRKRFFDENNPASWTQGRNMPIQGTAGGDMIKLAVAELTEWIWDQRIEGGVVNIIHDEILAHVPEGEAPRVEAAMKRIMEEVGQRMCPTVPIKANAYCDDIWRK